MESGQMKNHVLIIGEEEDFTRVLAVYLSDLGLHTSTASRWTDALTRIEEESPGVVLLDPLLPTVQGETILKFLRQEGNSVPVVIMSDHLEARRIETLKSLGASEFVQKTFAFYQIAQAIAKVLPGWSAENAPLISEEEFQRIVEQRLGEIDQELEDRPPPMVDIKPQPISSVSVPSQSVSNPPEASDAVSSRPPEVAPQPSTPPIEVQEPLPEPPPPPPQPSEPSEPEHNRRRVRHRRKVGSRTTKRVVISFSLVCLAVGFMYFYLWKAIADFVASG